MKLFSFQLIDRVFDIRLHVDAVLIHLIGLGICFIDVFLKRFSFQNE